MLYIFKVFIFLHYHIAWRWLTVVETRRYKVLLLINTNNNEIFLTSRNFWLLFYITKGADVKMKVRRSVCFESKIYVDTCSFVCFSALEYCLNVENMNLSAIRTIRVLRPLRAINRIPSEFLSVFRSYLITLICSGDFLKIRNGTLCISSSGPASQTPAATYASPPIVDSSFVNNSPTCWTIINDTRKGRLSNYI